MSPSSFEPRERARLHPLVADRPTPNFFSGALLGNGGLGVTLTTRPDAIVLHFGHNDVWDIRVAEQHADEIGTFEEVFQRVKAIPDSYAQLDEDDWYREYCAMTADNYDQPYPRPFPCGSVVLGFDRNVVQVLGHHLDIADGVCSVRLEIDRAPATLQCFVEPAADRVWLRLVDAAGTPRSAPWERVRVLPDPDGLTADGAIASDDPYAWIPNDRTVDGKAEDTDGAAEQQIGYGLYAQTALPAGTLSFRQVLPFAVDGAMHPKDRAFRLTMYVNGDLERGSRTNWLGVVEQMPLLERRWSGEASFLGVVTLDHGLASALPDPCTYTPTPADWATATRDRDTHWEDYWSRSGVALDDQTFERMWYHNLYFLNCAMRAGVTCPGLFANWSYRTIGTAWHGDYHLNYNTQQPFWATFSTNHVDKHLPYVDLVDHILPLSKRWARDYYGLRGAYFPHSAYPVEMNIMPYPVPTWGWEICETPWTVQSLWWHYLYTQDHLFLEQRAFEPIRQAVLFLVDYMGRPDAHGAHWNDDRYHIFPTVVPELYGLTPGLTKNYDCLADLTLTKFIFRAFLEATTLLGRDEAEAELRAAVITILDHFPNYATAPSSQGDVFVTVPGETSEMVYNVPVPLMTVFPGEEDGLHSTPERLEIARNTYRNQHIEGGNDLVMANLQGARLGILDLERFKKDVAYCMLPNGTATNMVQQVHGRYSDTTPYDFMAPMGIWLENFALPTVINECLLQSYTGELRLFPNWPATAGRAEFRSFRAVGAFLVSGAVRDGIVEWIEITSERGGQLRVYVPWSSGARCQRQGSVSVVTDGLATWETVAGETLLLMPNHI